MKIRNIYLTVFILSVVSLLFVSTTTAPDIKFFNAFGYNVGINITQYIWLKALGIISLCLYLIPFLKSTKATEIVDSK